MIRTYPDDPLEYAPGTPRWRLAAAIQAGIDLLNSLDGDADLEDSDGDACRFEDMPQSEGGLSYPGDPEDAEPETDSEPTPYD